MQSRHFKMRLFGGAAPAVLAILGTGSAAAQDAAATDTTNAALKLEEVVVTGTLIRGVTAPVGTNVIGLDAAAVQNAGVNSSNDLLARIPQVSNAFNVAQTPAGTISLPIVRPNIRNLGASGGSTTLILLDGKRMVGAGVLQTSPDPSAIPPGMIERVEIIPDGGSSIYGSDAIGGVINFITRKRADGVEVAARYGMAEDYYQTDLDLTGGLSWEGGSALLSYSFVEHDNILGSQRDWIHADNTAFGGSDYRVSNCTPGNITVGSVTYALPSRTPGTNRCDETDVIDFYPREERHSVFGSLTQKLGELVTADVSAYYSRRETLRIGQSPADGTGLRGSGTITASNPYFRPIGSETSQTVAFDYSSAFGVERSPSEFTSSGISPSFTIRLGDDWQVRALANYGRSTNEVRTFQVDTTAQAAALAGTTTATALNPYDVTATAPQVLAAIRDFEVGGSSTQQIGQYRAVADGALFTLPAGDLRLALGAEYYDETLKAAQGQGPRGAPVLFRSNSQRHVKSVFTELLAPLLDSDSAIGGLDLSASVRYDQYSDVGDTTNPKYGFTWQPLEVMQIRGNWGTSFHAPSLADTGDAVDTRAQVLTVSPFRAASSAPSDLFRPTILVAGGNADLKPEEAETWSIGVEWTPQGVLAGFHAGLTYFNVEFTDAIGLAPFYTGASFYANPSYAPFYIFNPTQEQAQQATQGLRVENAPSIASLYTGGATPYVLIDARRQNLGSVDVDGLDFSLSHQRDTTFGSVRASIAGTYTLNRETRAVVGAAPANELKNGTGRLNLTASVGATVGNLSGTLTANHSGGYPVIGVPGQTRVDSFTTVNLVFRYDLTMLGAWSENAAVTLNADNVFDEAPPYYNDADGYANGSTIGRLVTVGLRKQF